MKPVYIFTHHSRLRYPRPDNGAGCHQGAVAVAAKLGEQSAHGRTLNIETAVGLTRFELVQHLSVLFEIIHPVYIHLNPTVPADNFSALLDVPDAALTEDVQFLEAQCFGHIHIPLGGGKSFWRHIQCCICGQWLFRNQHSTCVNASQVGKIHQATPGLINVPGNMIIVQIAPGILYQLVNLFFGQSIYLAQFSEYGTVPEGGDGSDQCGMFAPIPLENIVEHLIPLLP